MEYRNIDSDINLHNGAKRYYQGDITKDQLYWKLESEGYSQKEINLAIDDYYLIYVRTAKFERFFVYLGIALITIYIIYKWLGSS